MMMPYFDDPDQLADYDSHQEALAAVEAGLQHQRADSKKVYRIDIPNQQMSVFGVAINHGDGADHFITQQIDLASQSHAAHFPYEILVVKDEVIALNGKFRIAINWPSLSMMGSGSFMSISGAPDAITQALAAVATDKPIRAESDSYF